jgi:hypothetical protein
MSTKNPHAVALGRKGGKVTSEAKRKASSKNWKKALAVILENRRMKRERTVNKILQPAP